MSDNPVIEMLKQDIRLTATLKPPLPLETVLDEWYATLSAAVEEGDGGLPPLDSTTLYLDSLGEPHWTASSADVERWQADRDRWTQEALDYVKGPQNGD